MNFIESNYGPGVNLYKVLEVDQEASQKTIQSAFVKRRMELSKLISNKSIIEKKRIEREMDAVSAVFRILRDPKKRRDYDRTLNYKPNKASNRSNMSQRSIMDYYESSNDLATSLSNELIDLTVPTSSSTLCSKENPVEACPRTPMVSNQSKSRKVSFLMDDSITANVDSDNNFDTEYDDDDDDQTVATIGTIETIETMFIEYYKDVVTPAETILGGWLRKNRWKNEANAVDKWWAELAGSIKDIELTFHQVISAFEIDDSAIDFMSGRINMAASDLKSRKYRHRR